MNLTLTVLVALAIGFALGLAFAIALAVFLMASGEQQEPPSLPPSVHDDTYPWGGW